MASCPGLPYIIYMYIYKYDISCNPSKTKWEMCYGQLCSVYLIYIIYVCVYTIYHVALGKRSETCVMADCAVYICIYINIYIRIYHVTHEKRAWVILWRSRSQSGKDYIGFSKGSYTWAPFNPSVPYFRDIHGVLGGLQLGSHDAERR